MFREIGGIVLMCLIPVAAIAQSTMYSGSLQKTEKIVR
jgi:hypothetical protein